MIAGTPVDINDLFSLSFRTVSKKVEVIRLDINRYMLSIQMKMNSRDVCIYVRATTESLHRIGFILFRVRYCQEKVCLKKNL